MDAFRRETRLSTSDDLPRVLAFMEECCHDASVKETLWFDLQLALEEACCNVIEHAYDGEGDEFCVCVEAHGSDLVITLRDQGEPFDPASVPAPDMHLPLDERRIGGLGLHLIYQLMDEVRFDFDESVNTLTMVKHNAIPEGG